LDLDPRDVELYLVLRESARQRLFNAVSWLGPQLLALVEHYAREIRIDSSAIEDAIDIDDLSQLTPEKAQEMSERLRGRLFEPTRTPEQDGVLQ
ncbi:hydrolase, partial [Pseudomonas sp. GW456-11-11-14-LB2]